MLDFNHLITRPGVDVQVFNLPSTVTNLQWHTWNRPRGTTYCIIRAVGGGGGGGGGFTRAAGNAGGGGGGGGSSGHAQISVPLELLPDLLYVQVAIGGAGVSSGTGATGLISFVSIIPNSTALNCVLASTSASGGGAASGTGAAAGTGGGAGTTTAITANPLAGLGTWNSTVGQAGSSGGAQTGAAGSSVAFPTIGLLTMGGTGGGGTTSADFAGGSITAIASSLLSDIRPTNAAAGSNDGSSGFNVMKPFFSFPGMGGGSSNAGVGGRGGYGFYGSGGGGGGAGTTGGRGGDGGNGVVIIVSY